MAKAKRYDEGGVTEGQNKGIDDDTRARAMKYVQEQSEKADSEEPEVKAKTVTKVTKAKSEPKAKSETKPEPKTESKSVKMTREESIAAIPTGGKKGAGPTESKGNSASGSELERNLSAAANTFAPAGSKIVKGGAATVKGVKELIESRKAAKTAQAAREAKTLNPNAWLAGPKGMKENFKKGGSVKGWGISRGARAAKVY